MNTPTPSALLPTNPVLRASLTHKLRELVSVIYPANAFYRTKLRASGLPGTDFSLEQFCTRMPFTTRNEWVEDQERQAPYGTNLSFPLTRYTRFSRTSGSTGIPKIWLDTPESWQAMLDVWRQVYTSAGVTAGSHVFFAFSFGPFLGFWTAFDAATQLGCLCVPGGGLSTDARLAVLADTGADTLCCTPTYAIHLGQRARDLGLRVSPAQKDIHVRRIIVAGEPGGSLPATRTLISDLWGGAGVFDHHGMTEVGPVTYQPDDEPGRLVVTESSFLAEVIDPASDAPVHEGEQGELVLTTLRRAGSPLLRYRTGDLVRATRDVVDESGERRLVLEGGIIGRVDDMVVVRGVNVFPSAVENIVHSMPNVTEYAVHIGETRSMLDLAVRVEWAATCPDTATACKELEHRLRNAFALRIPVASARRGELPRCELKAQRWIHASETGLHP